MTTNPGSFQTFLAAFLKCKVKTRHSISSGFAGFWGGLPFWIIAIIVMLMAAYDFYDETVRKKN